MRIALILILILSVVAEDKSTNRKYFFCYKVQVKTDLQTQPLRFEAYFTLILEETVFP